MFQADQRRHSLVIQPVPVLKTAQVTPCLQLIQSVRLHPVADTDPVLPKSPSKGNTHPGLKSPPSAAHAGEALTVRVAG